MEVWIAGATGVLGRHIVPRLLEAGHRVVGMARSMEKWPQPPPAMRFVACDITSPGSVARVFAGVKPDAILHMATAIPEGKPTAKDWAQNDAVRRQGTENLVEAARVCEAFYVQQSVHYVMDPAGDRPIVETDKVARSPITESAVDAENTVKKAMIEGVGACVIRPAMFYTAESSQIRAILHAIKSGMPIQVGNGQNYWSLIHPADVASAIVRILEVRPVGETFLLADDEPVLMAECLKWLAEQIHAKPPKHIAPFLAKMAMGGDLVDMLTGSRRISNAKAKQMLGWQPAVPSFRVGFPPILRELHYA